MFNIFRKKVRPDMVEAEERYQKALAEHTKFRPMRSVFFKMFSDFYKSIESGCGPLEAGRLAGEIYYALCEHYDAECRRLEDKTKNQGEKE